MGGAVDADDVIGKKILYIKKREVFKRGLLRPLVDIGLEGNVKLSGLGRIYYAPPRASDALRETDVI